MSRIWMPDRRLMMPAGAGATGCRGARAGEPTPILDLDFRGDTPGVWTSHASRDLTYTGGVAGGVVQTAAAAFSVATSGTNQGLIKSRGVSGRIGHLIRRAFTNRVLRARALGTTNFAAGWATGSGVSYSSSGVGLMSGTSDAQRIQVNSGGYSAYYGETLAAGDWTAALWRRAVSGTTTHRIGYGRIAAGSNIDSSTASTTWERRKLTHTGNGANAFYLVPALGGGFGYTGETNATQDVICDLAQVQSGRIAYDPVISTGSALTWAADSLISGSATNLSSSGRLTLWYQFVAEGGSSDYPSGSAYLFDHRGTSSQSAFCRIDTATRAVSMQVGGGATVTLGTAFPTWSEYDLIDVVVQLGNGYERAVARVNEGAATVCGVGPGTSASVNATTALHHLASSGASHFDSALVRVRAYASGQCPSWAA